MFGGKQFVSKFGTVVNYGLQISRTGERGPTGPAGEDRITNLSEADDVALTTLTDTELLTWNANKWANNDFLLGNHTINSFADPASAQASLTEGQLYRLTSSPTLRIRMPDSFYHTPNIYDTTNTYAKHVYLMDQLNGSLGITDEVGGLDYAIQGSGTDPIADGDVPPNNRYVEQGTSIDYRNSHGSGGRAHVASSSGSPLETATNVGFEFWIKLDDITFWGTFTLGRPSFDQGGFNFNVDSNNGGVRIVVPNSSSSQNLFSVPYTNTWIHVGFTIINGVGTVYIDGSQTDSQILNEAYMPFVTDSVLVIGGNENASRTFDGHMTQLRYFTINNSSFDPNSDFAFWRPDVTKFQMTARTTTTGLTFYFGMRDVTENVDIDWGDGNTDTNVSSDISHQYATPQQDYVIKVTKGQFRLYLQGNDELLSIDEWTQNNGIVAGNFSFDDCGNFETIDSGCHCKFKGSVAYVFTRCEKLKCSDVSLWDWSEADFRLVTGTVVDYTAFINCYEFNPTPSSFSGWDMSNFSTQPNGLRHFFESNPLINPDVTNWDVSGVLNFQRMFKDCPQFEGIGLETWDVSSATDMSQFHTSGTAITTAQLDAIYNAWSQQTLQSGVSLEFNAGCSIAGITARQAIIDQGWTITDNSPEIKLQVTARTTSTNEDFVFNMVNVVENLDIHWGDGSYDTNVSSDITHTYATAGDHQISLTKGEFELKPVNNTRFLSIDKWTQNNGITIAGFAFFNNNTIERIDSGCYVKVTGASNLFKSCYKLKCSDVSLWDWSEAEINNYDSVFTDCNEFEPTPSSFSGWDVSNFKTKAVGMKRFFYRCPLVNPDVTGWDVSGVLNFEDMFYECSEFEGIGLETWDVSAATSMAGFNANGSSITPAQLDAIYIAWSQLTLQSGVSITFDAGCSIAGITARQAIIDQGWTITDNTVIKLQMTARTTSSPQNFTFGMRDVVENLDIHWGDGSYDTNVSSDITHSYATAGDYPIYVTKGQFRIYMNDNEQLLSIDKWTQNNGIYAGEYAFNSCGNLETIDSGCHCKFKGPVGWAFVRTTKVKCSDVSLWDWSEAHQGGIATLIHLCNELDPLPSSFSGWDVSNFKTQPNGLKRFFQNNSTNTAIYNPHVTGWDVAGCANFERMFQNCPLWEGIGLETWDVSSATDMTSFNLSGNISATQLDAIYNAWSQLNLQSGVSIVFDANYTSAGAAAKATIQGKGWTITDNGQI